MGNRQLHGLVRFVSASVLVALVSGCQVTGGSPEGGVWDPADVRTGGGSIPDGARVSGSVVDYSVQTRAMHGEPWLGLGMESPPASGPSTAGAAGGGALLSMHARCATVTITGPDGTTQSTTASDGLLPDGTLDPLGAGRFAFERPVSGKSILSFDLNGNSTVTDVEVRTKGWERTEVVTALLADGGAIPSGKPQISCTVDRLAAGSAPVPISLSARSLGSTLPDVVWVMQTLTDTAIMPSVSPYEILVVPGEMRGDTVVWASFGTRRSNLVRIKVSAR